MDILNIDYEKNKIDAIEVYFLFSLKKVFDSLEKIIIHIPIGHIEINDMSDEIGADEYAISKLGSDLALDALSYLFIDTVKETFVDKETMHKAFKSLTTRIKTIKVLNAVA